MKTKEKSFESSSKKRKKTEKRFKTIGLICRFKPLHNGAASMLEAACENAEHVKIGIGSSNKYNIRNPFTAEESKDMVDAFLSEKYSNYSFHFILDFAHIPKYKDGQRWTKEIFKQFGFLDGFITMDTYVIELLKKDYNIIDPFSIITKKQAPVRGTAVRIEMAKKGDNWKQYVPEEVIDYLEKNKLVDRFRKEFGEQTLELLNEKKDYNGITDAKTEKDYTMMV
ncbi:MAG: hypothetical protein KKF46_02315 [Nanoarchaeota archaeon]|nr:hypothetical protein [Nanoarchaeota archaeon]MBU1321166.1 hypothetical protein [Nanoarchaeota archaeon]MBU1596966.1 hypothetical protein [Nanoarchaeota archaeon]MBU2441516.1 hypothetical protein [Nanoarchaeota archaeon]